MKRVHIVALVLAGAVGGAVLMKVVQPPEPVVALTQSAPPQDPQDMPAAAPAASAPSPQPAAPQPEAAATTIPAGQAPAVERAQAGPVSPAEPPAPRPKKAAVRVHHSTAPPPANPRPLIVAQLQPAQVRPPQPAPVQPPAPAQADRAAEPVINENPTPQAPPAVPQPENVTPPAPPQPTPHTVTLNAGLLIPVRLVDGLTSERNSPGDLFVATLDRELVVDGFVIAERGARVEGRVVAADRGTKMNSGATLSVELTRLYTSDQQIVPIETDPFEKHVQADRRQDAEKIGGGLALGAIIGAIAGGGKGAAIGAGVGGGAGAGDVMLTRKPAALPSETRITFRLRASRMLTEKLSG
jgi:hypothetical protein